MIVQPDHMGSLHALEFVAFTCVREGYSYAPPLRLSPHNGGDPSRAVLELCGLPIEPIEPIEPRLLRMYTLSACQQMRPGWRKLYSVYQSYGCRHQTDPFFDVCVFIYTYTVQLCLLGLRLHLQNVHS